MDKSWMQLLNRSSDDYRDGVRRFLDFAYANVEPGSKIRCPCLKCNNFYQQTREDVQRHLLITGIVKSYNQWIHHGEPFESHSENDWVKEESTSHGPQLPKGEAEKIAKMKRDAQQQLYPGCQTFTKLSFLTELMHLKSDNDWSEESFDMLLELLNDLLPDGTNLPNSFYVAKKIAEAKDSTENDQTPSEPIKKEPSKAEEATEAKTKLPEAEKTETPVGQTPTQDDVVAPEKAEAEKAAKLHQSQKAVTPRKRKQKKKVK